jgi:ABC-type polar amino acid transport system ATPase subunit
VPDPIASLASSPAFIIELCDVEKCFGSVQVLRGVNLCVRAREKVVIIGPSGSGKSTLIRCINGLEECDAGRILVLGRELTHAARELDAVRREVGMVFQQFNLFPHLTVIENLTLAPMVVRGLERDAAIERGMQNLRKVRMQDHAAKYPAQLSGGQQQRVAIARSLCMEPRVMLFDEPTSALDPEMVKEVLDVMVQLADDGMTMICVSHEMGFARTIADTIVFMDNGEIVERASPREFFSAPRSERSRSFLGKVLQHTG